MRKITQESTQKGLKEKSAQESTLGTAQKNDRKENSWKKESKKGPQKTQKTKGGNVQKNYKQTSAGL